MEINLFNLFFSLIFNMSQIVICHDCDLIYDASETKHVCTAVPKPDVGCNEIGCPGGHCERCTHVICICGIDDVYCQFCGVVECELPHCYECGEVECLGNHCDTCGTIDCKLEHCYECGDVDCRGGHCSRCGNVECTCLPDESDEWCNKCDRSNASCTCNRVRLIICSNCDHSLIGGCLCK